MGATKRALVVVSKSEGGQGRPEAARRGSLDGPVRVGADDWVRSPSGLRGRVADAGDACAVVSRSSGCEVQAGQARLLGHVFAGPRRRVRAWSDAAQPAVLNHILPTRPKGVMPLYEHACWLRPSVTLAPGRRGNGSRRRAARRTRG